MSDRILATYRIAAPEAEIRARAEALAIEQSVEMPVGAIEDRRVLDEVVATVADIRLGSVPEPTPSRGQFRN